MRKGFLFGGITLAGLVGVSVAYIYAPPVVLKDLAIGDNGVEVSALTVCKPKLVPIPFVSKQCDSTLSETIASKQAYAHLTQVLRDSVWGDTVVLHLKGNGGLVSGEESIEQAIKSSKAHVVTSAEGDVYSAHAFLAVAGDEVILAPNINLLFHRMAMQGKSLPQLLKEGYCDSAEGTDRGQSNKDKCLTFFKTQIDKEDKWLKETMNPFLKPSEVQAVIDGYDVIINSDVINARLGK